MKDRIFRKKSLNRVSSPEQLNDYIRVTSPGIWIILAAVLMMIVGLIVWGVVDKIETKISAVAVSEGGAVVCYVKETDIGKVEKSDVVRIDGKDCTVLEISTDHMEVVEGGELSPYARRIGGLSIGEWVYKVTIKSEAPAGVYVASIVYDRVSPITFLFN